MIDIWRSMYKRGIYIITLTITYPSHSNGQRNLQGGGGGGISHVPKWGRTVGRTVSRRSLATFPSRPALDVERPHEYSHKGRTSSSSDT